jgi:NAD(P)-dependent dehydrogenase (short-subunit alcohol dehydrogenase family)
VRIEPGQVAVITGGASGIGYGLAEALAARGVRIVVSDIREDGVVGAETSLRKTGAEVIGVVTDVCVEASVRELADRTLAAYDRVDLVCNNAGVVCPDAPMWEQEAATWERLIGVKVLGVVHGVQVFAPLLIDRGAGHFLNTASAGGLAPLPGMAPYAGTMHAVVGLTETLDVELKRVTPALGATVLCPGRVETALRQNSATLGAIRLPAGAPPPASDGDGVLSPRAVAEAAIEAIEAGRVHVAPGPTVPGRARARVEALLADIGNP